MIISLGKTIIQDSQNSRDVEDMVNDTIYNGEQVIDQIAYLNVIEWLNDPVMDSIVTNFWNGPYELDPIWKSSTNYRIIDAVVEEHSGYGSQKNNFSIGVYNPWSRSRQETLGMKSMRAIAGEVKNLSSGERRGRRAQKLGKHGPGSKNGHMFQFRVWRDSLVLKRILFGLVIVGYSVINQVLANFFIDAIDKAEEAEALWTAETNGGADPTLLAGYENDMLTNSQTAQDYNNSLMGLGLL